MVECFSGATNVVLYVKNFNQPYWHCNLPLLCTQCNYLTTIMSLIWFISCCYCTWPAAAQPRAQVNGEALWWSKAVCALLPDLDSEFSQRPGIILESTLQGTAGTLECGVCAGRSEWCPKCMIIYFSIMCTGQVRMQHLGTGWFVHSNGGSMRVSGSQWSQKPFFNMCNVCSSILVLFFCHPSTVPILILHSTRMYSSYLACIRCDFCGFGQLGIPCKYGKEPCLHSVKEKV